MIGYWGVVFAAVKAIEFNKKRALYVHPNTALSLFFGIRDFCKHTRNLLKYS